jgi:hypothetical protein
MNKPVFELGLPLYKPCRIPMFNTHVIKRLRSYSYTYLAYIFDNSNIVATTGNWKKWGCARP